MLALIARLRALPDERCVWGLTSLQRLCLLAHDTYKSPWFVIVVAVSDRYFIEYLMPAAVAPWPEARVQGEAGSEDEAIRMILIAMERSEGWQACSFGGLVFGRALELRPRSRSCARSESVLPS
jgi:hypothetical protein